MAGELTVGVAVHGDDTLSSGGGGGVVRVLTSKVFRKVKNALTFNIKGLKSGLNRTIKGSDEEHFESPITEAMEKLEVVKVVFMLAFPMTTGIIFMKNDDTLSPAVVHIVLMANMAGITATWNGMLLRKSCPRIASAVEKAGISLVSLGFHTLVGNYLSPELRFFPVMCWFFSMLPFFIDVIPAGGRTDQEGVKEEDVCPV